MNCEKYSEWIGDAVDGTLKPAEQRRARSALP